MAFDGLHTFNFDSGINTLIGGNASGKTSLISVISQALSPITTEYWDRNWHSNYGMNDSLIEMRFVAGGKEHYLRRVLKSDSTTDIHLYVDEGSKRDFYRDGEALDYMKNLKPISRIDGFENSRKDFYFWTTGTRTSVNPLFSRSRDVIKGINRFLPKAGGEVVQLRLVENDVMAQYRNGDLRHLSTLAGGDIKLIFVIAKIYNVFKQLEADDRSKVILFDEIEIGLDKAKLNGLYDAVSAISEELDCQFIITSRFANGRMNPIKLNQKKIPSCYIVGQPNNRLQLIHKYLKKYKYTFKQLPHSKIDFKNINWNAKFNKRW